MCGTFLCVPSLLAPFVGPVRPASPRSSVFVQTACETFLPFRSRLEFCVGRLGGKSDHSEHRLAVVPRTNLLLLRFAKAAVYSTAH